MLLRVVIFWGAYDFSYFSYYSLPCESEPPFCVRSWLNKRHAMHAEAMTFHKGSLRILRKFDRIISKKKINKSS